MQRLYNHLKPPFCGRQVLLERCSNFFHEALSINVQMDQIKACHPLEPTLRLRLSSSFSIFVRKTDADLT